MSDSREYGSRRRNVLRAVVFVLVSALILIAADLAGRYAAKKQNQMTENSHQDASPDENLVVDDKKTIMWGGKEYYARDNIEAVLVMGVDDGGVQESTVSYTNDDQSDFNVVLVIDHDSKSYTMLALNRDTITSIPCLDATGTITYRKDAQLALAHTYGTGREDSCVNQVQAVSELLFGTNIDHYISFSMPAIGIANDAVGGVTVTIADDFSKVDTSLKMGETIRLNGRQAETFVRGRGGMDEPTNLNRMSRQKTYMAAWKNAALEKYTGNGDFIFTLLGLVSDYMVSDMTANKLSELADQLSEYTDNGVCETKGEAVKGDAFMEYYVDQDDLRMTVLDLFYEENTAESGSE